MERGDKVRIVVGAFIILFGFLIILLELLYTTDTGLRLFTFQLVSVLIIIAGIVLVISTSRD
jgi:prolipoprotein diacylglyceryltransferase